MARIRARDNPATGSSSTAPCVEDCIDYSNAGFQVSNEQTSFFLGFAQFSGTFYSKLILTAAQVA